MSNVKDRVVSLLGAPETDEAVLLAVDSLGDEGRQLLLDAVMGQLPDVAPSARARAMHMLAALRWEPAAEQLGEQLGSSEPLLRLAAIGALRNLGGPEAEGRLMDLIEDPNADWVARASAVDAIAAIGGRKAASRLAEIAAAAPELQARLERAKMIFRRHLRPSTDQR